MGRPWNKTKQCAGKVMTFTLTLLKPWLCIPNTLSLVEWKDPFLY
jgi:hypothetical protein